MPLHEHVLIVRRPKLYYTVSGIITPIGGRPVHGTFDSLHFSTTLHLRLDSTRGGGRKVAYGKV